MSTPTHKAHALTCEYMHIPTQAHTYTDGSTLARVHILVYMYTDT